MKSSNFVIDGSIPSEWYINSLIEFLYKIPKEYTENSHSLHFDSIEKEVNESINTLDFEILSICLNKIKYIHKNIFYNIIILDKKIKTDYIMTIQKKY